MKTSENKNGFSDNLGLALYSINKIAKKYRDEALYGFGYTQSEAEEKMEYLYYLKRSVLDTLEPNQLHIQKTFQKERKTIEESDPMFRRIKTKVHYRYSDVKSCYIRYKTYETRQKRKLFYLHYNIGPFSFHSPINENKIDEYSHLKKKRLPRDFYMSADYEGDVMREDEAVSIVKEYLQNYS